MLPFHFAFAGPAQTLAPVTEADGRLGLCDVMAGNAPGLGGTPWAQLAYNAGARINRWEFRWDRIEPQPEVWNFADTDAVTQSDRAYGLDTLGILIGTPAWGAAPGQKPGNGLPKGLYFGYTDPRNLWATFVRETVNHYHGQVAYWEVWSEPDLPFFWMSTSEDYFRLLKVTDLVIHTVDPAAKVLMAGMVSPDLAFFQRVLNDAARDPTSGHVHGYFDVAAWHAYGAAKLLYANALQIRLLLAAAGFGNVPLWVTEDGFPASNPNGEPRQAAYVLQTIAYGLAGGADRVLVYRASDDASLKTWGILTALGEPRMAYVTYHVAARYFSHTQAVSYAPTADLERFVFYRGNRRLMLVWTRGLAGRSVDIPVDRPTPTFIDWMGNRVTPSARSGQYQLPVPGAAYNAGIDPAGSIVGGPPQLIDQDNTALANLKDELFVAPVRGSQRRLVLFNPGDSPTALQVAAVAQPKKYMALRVAAHSLRLVDLDLLAGNGYRGLYGVSSATALAGAAGSDQAAVPSANLASAWYMASAPATFNLSNPSEQTVGANVTVFGSKGAVRAWTTLRLLPHQSGGWSLPSTAGEGPLAVAVHAGAPIMVSGAGTARGGQTTWYALQPRGARVSVFNPDPAQSTRVKVRLEGLGTVRVKLVRVAPHHSALLPTHGAMAVVMAASRPIAVAYTRRALGAPAPTSVVVNEAAMPLVGNATRVNLFNPSQQFAHVRLSVVGGTSTREVTKILAPLRTSALSARTSSEGPRGVVVRSDVPIVAAASS